MVYQAKRQTKLRILLMSIPHTINKTFKVEAYVDNVMPAITSLVRQTFCHSKLAQPTVTSLKTRSVKPSSNAPALTSELLIQQPSSLGFAKTS